VDTWREALLIGDPPEQAAQGFALFGRERRADGVVVFSGDLDDGLEDLAAFAGEVERVDAAILGAAAALDQAALFELVDEEDEAARGEAEEGAQGLLADAGGCVDEAERAGESLFAPEPR
jgi:hypothetical protein